MDLPRGMRDVEPKESSMMEYVRQKFVETSSLFGFQYMEPSPIELLSVIETKSGPAIKNEVYYFTDKGDRDVALRFDFTIGLTRYAVSQKSMRLPAKFCTFGGVWRYDEPQKGRYRFFHQWDVEVYGEPNIESDAEVIEFIDKFFSTLNLQNIVIEICDRELIESYVKNIFKTDSSDVIADILRAVDKIQKKKKEEIIREYHEKGYPVDNLERVLEFSQIKGTLDEIGRKIDTKQLKNWDKLLHLFESLENRGVKNVRVNFGIVRGLDYYSGIIYEVFDTSSDLGALVGGGRYDTLTKAFGRSEMGAAGAAGGIERIMHSIEKQGIKISSDGEPVWVAFVNDEMKHVAIKVASRLRMKGIRTEMDLAGRNLKKQMEMASRVRRVVIVAPREFSENLVIVRNMEDGSEKKVDINLLMSDPGSSLQL